MYYPFLRGKKHELLTLLAVPTSLYSKMLPIVEPVNLSVQGRPSYRKLAAAGLPFILIVNPQHGKVAPSEVQKTLIEADLAAHSRLTLGFLIDRRYNLAALKDFLIANPSYEKAIIFRYNPSPADISLISAEVRKYSAVKHIVFDHTRLAASTSFAWHPNRIIISDGFQKEDKNANYSASSSFDTYLSSYASMGYAGFGDYLMVGDSYSETGGAGFVVTLHLTVPSRKDLNIHHFSSTKDSSIRGLQSGKFKEACASLVAALPRLSTPRTTGTACFEDWHRRDHFPQLGPAKQAAMQHHVEVVCSLI